MQFSQGTILNRVSQCMALYAKRWISLRCRDPRDSQEQSLAGTELDLFEKMGV